MVPEQRLTGIGSIILYAFLTVHYVCSFYSSIIKHIYCITVYTPTGKVELGSLKTTRSGRVVKPTLAWWAGQRVKTYDDNTFETTYISSHTPEILKEMSETYKVSNT